MKDCHPSVFFNNVVGLYPVEQTTSQKHLGIHLDEKLNFNAPINDKANRGIVIIKKLQSKLPRNVLLTIYKSFTRPHLGYGDVPYKSIILSFYSMLALGFPCAIYKIIIKP